MNVRKEKVSPNAVSKSCPCIAKETRAFPTFLLSMFVETEAVFIQYTYCVPSLLNHFKYSSRSPV